MLCACLRVGRGANFARVSMCVCARVFVLCIWVFVFLQVCLCVGRVHESVKTIKTSDYVLNLWEFQFCKLLEMHV